MVNWCSLQQRYQIERNECIDYFKNVLLSYFWLLFNFVGYIYPSLSIVPTLYLGCEGCNCRWPSLWKIMTLVVSFKLKDALGT